MPILSVILPPSLTPEAMLSAAHDAEAAGLSEVWVWEDCFKESGIASTAAILASTRRLTVGIGLLPVPLRNVAITAMEIATLSRMFPGRVLPGVGHGVLEWMAQVGARAASPMTLLREYTTALRALLHGERLTVSGRYVQLDDVALDWPPVQAPPLLVGGIKEKTLELAGELGDGIILTGGTTPEETAAAASRAQQSRARAGRDGQGEVVVFVGVPDHADAAAVIEQLHRQADAGATRLAVTVAEDRPVAPLIDLLATRILPALRNTR